MYKIKIRSKFSISIVGWIKQKGLIFYFDKNWNIKNYTNAIDYPHQNLKD